MQDPEEVSVIGMGWSEMVPAAGLPFEEKSAPPNPEAPDLLQLPVAQVFVEFDWEGRKAELVIPAGISVERFFNLLRW